jgi:hypothetical protein
MYVHYTRKEIKTSILIIHPLFKATGRRKTTYTTFYTVQREREREKVKRIARTKKKLCK